MSKPGGKSEEGGGGAGGGRVKTPSGNVNVSGAVKSVGLTHNSAILAAQYLSLPPNSPQKKVMDDLLRHGGMGGLGPIRLRTRDFGLPRDKLLDIEHVFKPLWEHGMISLATGNALKPKGGNGGGREPNWEDPNMVIHTTLGLTDVRKARKLSSDVLATLASSNPRRGR